ncbi:MAG: thioesterase family protein [Nocardioides sp.]
MSYAFDAALELTPTENSGEWGLTFDEGWTIGNGVNGGFLLALAGHAAVSALGDKPHPVAISAHYLAATHPGAGTVRTEVLRNGGTFATVRVEISQDERLCVAAQVSVGTLAQAAEADQAFAAPFQIPPIEQCVPSSMAPSEFLDQVQMLKQFELSMHPDHTGWAMGQPSGRGELAGWYQLRDGRDQDPVSLLQVVDALMPVTMDLGRFGWAPTLELTAHVRALPAPGPVQVRHRTTALHSGLFDEDCEVWDSAGVLVAQSRQLAVQPRG